MVKSLVVIFNPVKQYKLSVSTFTYYTIIELTYDMEIFVVTYYKLMAKMVIILKNVVTYYIKMGNYRFLRDFVVGKFMQTWEMGLSSLLFLPIHSLENRLVAGICDIGDFEYIDYPFGYGLFWGFWYMLLEDTYHIINGVLQLEKFLWQIVQ